MKKALVVHSGGMDSSICLKLAINEFSRKDVLSISFNYNHRHASQELKQAKKICSDWNVDHLVLDIPCLSQITQDALTNSSLPIDIPQDAPPNTLVLGRNGLMARLGAIHAHSLGAHCIYLGVIEVEEANSGYRDCSRNYMDLMQNILRIDLNDPTFEIRTPLVKMTKKETLKLAHELGVLNELLEKTITCYEGLPGSGCKTCPACILKNKGILDFTKAHPEIRLIIV